MGIPAIAYQCHMVSKRIAQVPLTYAHESSRSSLSWALSANRTETSRTPIYNSLLYVCAISDSFGPEIASLARIPYPVILVLRSPLTNLVISVDIIQIFDWLLVSTQWPRYADLTVYENDHCKSNTASLSWFYDFWPSRGAANKWWSRGD